MYLLLSPARDITQESSVRPSLPPAHPVSDVPLPVPPDQPTTSALSLRSAEEKKIGAAWRQLEKDGATFTHDQVEGLLRMRGNVERKNV